MPKALITSQKDDAKKMTADHKWHHIFPLEACSGLIMGAKIGTEVTLFHNVLYPKNKTTMIPVTNMESVSGEGASVIGGGPCCSYCPSSTHRNNSTPRENISTHVESLWLFSFSVKI